MGALTREAILAAKDVTTERVEVPEWLGYVYVRTIMGDDRDAFEAAIARTKRADGLVTPKQIRARLVALCVVDEQGQPVFTEEDVEALGRKSAAALDRVCEASERLNQLTVQSIESAVGNSEPGPSDGTTSG